MHSQGNLSTYLLDCQALEDCNKQIQSMAKEQQRQKQENSGAKKSTADTPATTSETKLRSRKGFPAKMVLLLDGPGIPRSSNGNLQKAIT